LTAPDGFAAHVAGALEKLDFHGVVLVDGPAGTELEFARGEADRGAHLPLRAASRFETASVSKLFTAVALLRQVERGEADLDAPLVDWLPEDRRPTTLDGAATLRHFLTHTSGITDYFDEQGNEPYEAIWERVPGAAMRTSRDMLSLFRDLPPRARPGEEVRYCDAGFVVLGNVVEHLAGVPFPEAVRREVFEPAGMTASGYPALDDIEPDLAIGYLPPDDRDPRWRSHVLSLPAVGGGDGGAVSNTADLVRFMRALRDERLIHNPLLAEAIAPAVHDAEEGGSYGLGFLIYGEGARRAIGHTGEDPGYSARALWYPEADVRIVVLSNVTWAAGPARGAVEELRFA
jgi:CubicO group peptidase (beta-lactamase class C family)